MIWSFFNFAEKFRSDLMNIARTTLSSKILSQDKEHFAELAVDAVMRLKVNISFALAAYEEYIFVFRRGISGLSASSIYFFKKM